MSHRTSIVAAFALGALCSTVAAWSARPGVARPTPAAPAEVDRYRFTVSDTTGPYVYVVDTTTGHCWRRLAGGANGWTDLGSPANSRD